MIPRVKAVPRQRVKDILVCMTPEGLVQLPDPHGHLWELLMLADGTRPHADIQRILTADPHRWTVARVRDAIATLDGAGLLEDVGQATVTSQPPATRYASNLEFYGLVSRMGRSRLEIHEDLRRSRVVVLGAGGIGSIVLLNLAGLGVGQIVVVDQDTVETANLNRQFLYEEESVGQPKAIAAAERIESLNSEVQVRALQRRVSGAADIAAVIGGADLLVCAADQPSELISWVNAACLGHGVPYVVGGVGAGKGMYYSVAPGGPCHACLRAISAGAETTFDRPAGARNPTTGPMATLLGGLIAMEALRYLTGFAPPVGRGRMWIVDFVRGSVEAAFVWRSRCDCPYCA